ncbi:hypothetical protein [Azospirillum melinis]
MGRAPGGRRPRAGSRAGRRRGGRAGLRGQQAALVRGSFLRRILDR